MPTPAFLLFAKAPRPGIAKTRLASVLGMDGAAQIAAALAQDAFRLLCRSATARALVAVIYAPHDAQGEFEELLPPANVLYLPQAEGDLGHRMATAVEQVAAMGHTPVVIIGADCPLLPPEALHQTLQYLDENRADVVLGPAEDGGYYLVGLQKPEPGLFDNITWSTDTVLDQTCANAEQLGLRVTTDLALCYDIDTPADLLRLYQGIQTDPRAAASTPSTAQWLRENAGRITSLSPVSDARP